MNRGRHLAFAAMAAAALAVVLGLAACGSGQGSAPAASSSAAATSVSKTGVDVRVATLKGPTSIGLASLMTKAKAGQTASNYSFTVTEAISDDVVPGIVKGTYDIALVPANVASVLYNKTNGGISAIDINTLGVLSVVTGDSSINSIADLAGHTVYMTGKGATPEYVMNYLLDKAGVSDSVTLEYKSEATEVAAALNADTKAIGILPEPYVTAVTTKNSALSARVSLDSAWNAAAGDTGSRMVTGVTVVRNEFLQAHPDVVKEFVAEQKASVEAVKADPEGNAQAIVDAGIVDNASVAAKAVPNCNLACITDTEMQTALTGYYNVLYMADPSSVGGTLPADNFYWLG